MEYSLDGPLPKLCPAVALSHQDGLHSAVALLLKAALIQVSETGSWEPLVVYSPRMQQYVIIGGWWYTAYQKKKKYGHSPNSPSTEFFMEFINFAKIVMIRFIPTHVPM
jgi:hypothetical protein